MLSSQVDSIFFDRGTMPSTWNFGFTLLKCCGRGFLYGSAEPFDLSSDPLREGQLSFMWAYLRNSDELIES